MPSKHQHRLTWILAAALSAAISAGCASAPQSNAAQNTTQHPQDPWERYNRSMTKFNDKLDSAVLEPVSSAYKTVTPQPMRTGVNNFFANLGDLWSMVNHALQGKGEKAYNHLVRFTTNTTLGLGGLLDIASAAQVPREKQDFGQTLGHWGIKPGPYLVLPLLGPSTLRDTVALPVDWQGNALNYLHPASDRNALTGLRFIDTRANLQGALDTLDAISLDRYSLIRDIYLRQRNAPAGGNGGVDGDGYDEDAGKLEDFDD